MDNLSHFHSLEELIRALDRERKLLHALFQGRKKMSFRYELARELASKKDESLEFLRFDLAGINIFLTEFYVHLGMRSSFLIPEDIEMRLCYNGSKERYDSQYQRFHNLRTDIPLLQSLIDLINKYHRCYD